MAASLLKSRLTKLTRDEMAKRRRESFNPRVDPPDEKFHPIAKNMSVGIWKGWKASLIVSKQKGLPVVAWDGPIEEAQAEERKKKIEPSSVESSLTGTVCPLKRCSRKRDRTEKALPVIAWEGSIEDGVEERKKKIEPSSVESSLTGTVCPLKRCSRKRERTEKALPVIARDGSIEEARAEERKRKIEPSSVKLSLMGKVGPLKSCSTKRKRINDSALAHPAALLFDEMGVEDMKLLKEGVDALSMRVMLNVSCLRLLHELLGDDSYRRFMESVFRSVANFVLSVFDKEDFERIHHDDEICGEWQTVCSMLTDKIGTSTKEEVVGKAVDTVIKESHRFPALTDHDFCQILGGYAERIGQFKILAPVHYVGYPFRFDFLPITVKNDGIIRPSQWLQKDDIHKSFRDNVIEEAIQNFVPLKEYCKTQLGLELLCTNGYRVYDALVIEVLKDIKIDRLFEITHKAPKEYEDFDFSNPRAVVSHVLIDIVKGLYTLGYFKPIALKFSENALASCVSNTFGPCKTEVIEVIKIADCERRINNKPSISLENIRYGLSLSRVGEFVKEIPAGSPPKFSIFEFFKLSRQKAIDMDDEKVGLQHLVLAMDTVLSKDLMENASPVRGADKVVARHLKWVGTRFPKERHIDEEGQQQLDGLGMTTVVFALVSLICTDTPVGCWMSS